MQGLTAAAQKLAQAQDKAATVAPQPTAQHSWVDTVAQKAMNQRPEIPGTRTL